MGYWRQHSSQATAKMFKEQMIGHAQIVNEFYRKLPPDLKKSLKINYKLIKGNNCWLRGKAELINKEWQGSRKELAEAVLSAPFLIKLKSILGLVISFFHADLEKIAKFKRFLNGIF